MCYKAKRALLMAQGALGGEAVGLILTNTKCCWQPSERSLSTPAAVFGLNKPQDKAVQSNAAVGKERGKDQRREVCGPD